MYKFSGHCIVWIMNGTSSQKGEVKDFTKNQKTNQK